MKWTNYTEPARIRAIVVAVVALAAALGIVLPFDLPGIAEAGIGLLAVLLPLIQGEVTRAAVDSPQTVERKVAAATDGFPVDEPGDHAAREA